MAGGHLCDGARSRDYGTVDLLGASKGAGGGQGPNPLSKPADMANVLQIQVIGQQWLWTFRYPGYGGVETTQLELPVNRWIEFHVTSLDVVHSFWAYRARGQGRRRARHRQRRLREAAEDRQLPSPLCGALRRSGMGT